MKDNRLFHFLRSSPLRNLPLYHLVRFAMTERKIKKAVIRRGYDFAKLRPQLVESMIKYHWSTEEFFVYHYTELTPEQRQSFVPDYDKNVFCNRVNDYNTSKIFKSKWQTYQKFKDFFGRDCCIVSHSLIDKRDEKIMSFLSKHTEFIIKPNLGTLGNGVAIIQTTDSDDAISAISSKIRGKKGDFVIEELIHQSPELGVFHPTSVNTIRLRVFRFDDRVEILPSNLRIGSGDSVVDNTGKGGISAALDKDGVVVAACDNKGNYYEVHPDTGVRIIGFRVPRWEEAIALANKLCQIVPKVRYIGWDIALTEKGWVVIEGNDNGMFEGIQMPLQKGFRPQLDKILSEMNISI